MLTIVDITEENREQYSNFVPGQYLSDIGREYFRGIVGLDNNTQEPIAAVIWEVHNLNKEDVPNQAEIHWFSTQNEEDADALLQAFDCGIINEDVQSTVFELEKLRDYEISVFEKAGFVTKNTEGIDILVTVEEVGKLDIAKKKAKDYVVSLSEVSSFQFMAGIMNSAYRGSYGLLEDLPFLPMSRYDQKTSCCVTADNNVTGLLLVYLMMPELYRVELLSTEKLDGAINVLNMLRFSVQAAQKSCQPTDKVLIRRHNRTVTDLCKKLFPGKKGKQVIRGVRPAIRER